MIKIRLPQHNEAQTTRRLQPAYTGRRCFSDPSDTLPSAGARSKEKFSYLYRGGKWVASDDGYFNKDASGRPSGI